MVAVPIPRALLVALLLAVVTLPARASDLAILPLEGRQTVGTMKFTWSDASRPDPGLGTEQRRIIVQLWYPAARQRGARPAPYAMELSILRDDLQSRLKIDDPDALATVSTHALLEAPVAGGGAHPVVLFSHGFGTPRAMYTSFVRGLAAAGYFVAAIDHPGMGVVALDDRLITPYPIWVRVPAGVAELSEEERDRHGLPQRLYLSADQRFVLDQLEHLNASDARFRGRLDLKRVAMAGHSRGFLSPTCAQDRRIKACVNLNGVPALTERRSGLEIPLLTVRASRGDDGVMQTAIHAAMRAAWYDVLVEGSHHSSVTDRDLLSARSRQNGERRLRVINAVVIAFLDQTLRGRPSTLQHLTPRFPEVRLTIGEERGSSPTHGREHPDASRNATPVW